MNAVSLLLDEYKPAEWRQRNRDAFHEHIRDTSMGSTTTKTWNDPMQKTYRLDTGVALFGEGRLPDDANALARRTIETTLSQCATTPDTPMYRTFKELATAHADDSEKATLHHALGWWSFALSRVEDKLSLVEAWEDARKWALKEIESRGHDLPEVLDCDIYRQHVQTVTFSVRVWREFAGTSSVPITRSSRRMRRLGTPSSASRCRRRTRLPSTAPTATNCSNSPHGRLRRSKTASRRTSASASTSRSFTKTLRPDRPSCGCTSGVSSSS